MLKLSKINSRTVKDCKTSIKTLKIKLANNNAFMVKESNSSSFAQLITAYKELCQVYYIKSYDLNHEIAEKNIEKCKKYIELCYKILTAENQDLNGLGDLSSDKFTQNKLILAKA